MLTDTHCHVLKEYYNDKKSILDNAKEQGVLRIINASYNMASSLEVIKDVKKYDNVYGVVGLHPENCLEEFDYKIFDSLPSKIVGIGEIGLDYHYGKENKNEQITIFERQLVIAERLNLPVVIHSRDATLDTIEILKRHKVKGVIHSFSGSYETACIYIKMGFVSLKMWRSLIFFGKRVDNCLAIVYNEHMNNRSNELHGGNANEKGI